MEKYSILLLNKEGLFALKEGSLESLTVQFELNLGKDFFGENPPKDIHALIEIVRKRMPNVKVYFIDQNK